MHLGVKNYTISISACSFFKTTCMTSTFKILECSGCYSSFFTECPPDTCQSVCVGCSAFHPHLYHIGPISSRYKVEGQTLFLSKVETLLGHLHVSFETAEHIKEQKIRDMQSLTLANNALICNLTKDMKFTIYLVSDHQTWNLRPVLSEFFVPIWEVLICDFPLDIKHLAKTIVLILKAFLRSTVYEKHSK